MSDYNTFAILTPFDNKGNSVTAIRLSINAKRFRTGTPGPSSVAEEPTIPSRASTPGPEDENPASARPHTPPANYIRLGLDDILKDPTHMWQLGTKTETSDFVLGYRGTKLVSSSHCNITIDDDLWIWLHDHSTYGTAVGYDDQMADQIRKRDTWILSYEPGWEAISLGKKITIHVGQMAFNIEFPNHQEGHPRYIQNLRAFIENCKRGYPPLASLGLASVPSTKNPSLDLTPNTSPLYLDYERLGGGSFGEVWRTIKLRDGKHYAAKRYFPRNCPSHGKRKLDEFQGIYEVDEPWLKEIRKEFTIMKNNPHRNIVEVIDFVDTANPVLYMELYPLGHLDRAKVPPNHVATAFANILDGIRHLHENGVAHRDLKPENVLVKHDPFTVAIADFGESKVKEDNGTLLKTFCGTLEYMAPEIFPGMCDTESAGYGFKVDIWSAGVMVLTCFYNMPAAPPRPIRRERDRRVTDDDYRQWVQDWASTLLKGLYDHRSDKVLKVLMRMLERDPQRRWSAMQCLDYGVDIDLFKETNDGRYVGADDPDFRDDDSGDDDDDDGTKTLTARSPTVRFWENHPSKSSSIRSKILPLFNRVQSFEIAITTATSNHQSADPVGASVEISLEVKFARCEIETCEELTIDEFDYDTNEELHADILSTMVMFLDQMGISPKPATVERNADSELLYYIQYNNQGGSLLQSNMFETAGIAFAFEACLAKSNSGATRAKYHLNMAIILPLIFICIGEITQRLFVWQFGVDLTEEKGRSGRYWWFLYDIACVELQSGDLAKALVSHLEILGDLKKIYGPEGEMTIESDYTIGLTHHLMGNLELSDKASFPSTERHASFVEDRKFLSFCEMRIIVGNHMFLPRLSSGKRSGEILVEVVKREDRHLIELWTAELCAAVAWLESLGLIHGDLRPTNILIDAEDHFKLVDFDCVERIGTRSYGGAPPWARLRPEDGIGEGSFGFYGPKTEQFAIGSLVYFMTRGFEPYEDLDDPETDVIDLFKENIFPRIQEDDTLDRVINRCWRGSYTSTSDLSRETALLPGAENMPTTVSLSADYCAAMRIECEKLVESGLLEKD
ncbi:hypothetical protein B7494_g3112 [Chlorociboria aeruginascens]|nr:hypothetical protein B7494_g3112 [Chlorociboria aeruginascens]